MIDRRKFYLFILALISLALIIIALFWDVRNNFVFAYNMITSQDIIDNDLILDRYTSKIGEIPTIRPSINLVSDIDEIYEPTTLDEVKEIITYIPKAERKVAPKYLIVSKHSVKEGESLWSIAKKYDIEVETLIYFNNLKTPKISVGQTLNVPNMDGILETVKKGDTIKTIAKRFNVKAEKIVEVNRLVSSAAQLKINSKIFVPGDKPKQLVKLAARAIVAERKRKIGVSFIWPTAVKSISSPFGWRIHPIFNRRIFHQGIDIVGTVGTKIYSAEEGRVYFRGFINGYGLVLIIKHKNNYSTVYTHLSKYEVKLNEWVEQGELIAQMGNTGRVTGPHLHFEIRHFDKPIDPQKLLN